MKDKLKLINDNKLNQETIKKMLEFMNTIDKIETILKNKCSKQLDELIDAKNNLNENINTFNTIINNLTNK